MPITASHGIMVLSGLIFLIFCAVTLLGALVATFAKRLIRNVSGLALSFVGMAGLYYYLHSPFLALMQIVIYVGAICIMIMFTMMLAELGDRNEALPLGPVFASLAIAGGLLMATGMVNLVVTSALPESPPVRAIVTAKELGRDLLNEHGLAFELISGVLLIAILGAILLARSGREKA
jgi:NADH:ubiquinone oxidoreductase subunit 6 (subunit J)